MYRYPDAAAQAELYMSAENTHAHTDCLADQRLQVDVRHRVNEHVILQREPLFTVIIESYKCCLHLYLGCSSHSVYSLHLHDS